MSGAAEPRFTGMFRDAAVAARTVIEDRTQLRGADADIVAEAVAERLLGDFLAIAEADSFFAFTPEGTGPVCTWCSRLPGPKLSPQHPQFGIFCDCKRADVTEPNHAA